MVLLVFLLIMKLGLLCAVAVCVAAGLPCDDYCTCLLSDIRKVAYQPECNCMYQELGLRGIDDSAIYYEPAEYLSLPTLAYERPFYILNPYVALREKHATDRAYRRLENAHRVPGTQIEINIENTHTLQKGKEKALGPNNINTAPIYLDINIEPDDSKRAISTEQFLSDDFRLTEQSLAECAELHIELNYRKNHDIIRLENKVTSQYKHFSDEDLMKKIEEKCSRITIIIDKSLREIKGKQSRKSNRTYLINSVEENNENQINDHISNSNKRNNDAVTKTSQLPVHFNEELRSGNTEYDVNQEHVIVIYTDSESGENTTKTLETLPTRESLTTSIWKSNEDSALPPDITKKDIEDVLTTSFDGLQEIHVTTPMDSGQDMDTDKEDLNTKTRIYTTSLANSQSSNAVNISRAKEKKSKKDILENERLNDLEVGATEVKRYKENRTHYTEGEVPLIKIITHEFNNDTVQSFINGTEDIPNGDFEDEMSLAGGNPTELPKTNRSEIESTIQDTESFERNDITGNLYFIYKHHPIPARFIQKPNGTLHIGVDGATLCDKLNQENKRKSALLTTMCKCYKFDNCTSGI